MEYSTNFMSPTLDPVDWARRREAQGWDFVSVADHYFTPGHPFPHSWVTAGAMAAATTTIGITTAFTNNLFRSPVEVAQAALTMQHVSQGRFELGLGAGWARPELDAAGLVYPEQRDRAGAFAESAEIVRSLLHTGACTFSGDYYTVQVDELGPLGPTPPPLVAAVGGPRTIREVTPHCDRVELKPASPATRGGTLDMAALASVRDQDLVDMIKLVRSIDPDIGIGMFVLCNAGDDALTRSMADTLSNSLYGRFYGEPARVVDGLAWLAELGISRCQLSPVHDACLDDLASLLYG